MSYVLSNFRRKTHEIFFTKKRFRLHCLQGFQGKPLRGWSFFLGSHRLKTWNPNPHSAFFKNHHFFHSASKGLSTNYVVKAVSRPPSLIVFVVKFTPNYILVVYFWILDTRQKFMREGGKRWSPEVTPTPIISIGGPPIFTDKNGVLIRGQRKIALYY